MRNYKITYWLEDEMIPSMSIIEASEIHEAISKFCDELDIRSQFIICVEVVAI